MHNFLNDIEVPPNVHSWTSIEPVNKGYSAEKKYKLCSDTGEDFLLRISDAAYYEAKRKEYEIVCKYARTGIRMSSPKAFGTCNQGQNTYMLLSWVEGADLTEILPSLSEQEQYQLGRQAGRILRKIHSIPLEEADHPVKTKVDHKLMQLNRYLNSTVRVPNDEVSIPYCIGQIDAYFDDNVPEIFWETQAVYVAHASLYSIKWAEKFGPKDIAGMVKRWNASYENYDGFTRIIPKWYKQKVYRSCCAVGKIDQQNG